MAGDIKVNFAALNQAGADLSTQANAIEGLLDDERGVLTTLNDAWTGSAKEAWHANQQRWQAKADELNAILHRLAATVSEIAQDAEAAENANKEAWE
jgi:WXG100 family type VII secretion target